MSTPLKKICYIDDADELRIMVSTVLERIHGYTIKVFANGEEAIQHVDDFNPDLILLDMWMPPNMNGIETFQAFQQQPHLQNIPVIFLTGQAEQEEVQQYTALGAIGVIAKPFNPMQLGATIDQIWQQFHAKEHA
jgi:two-component system, OmpR family, response regulator